MHSFRKFKVDIVSLTVASGTSDGFDRGERVRRVAGGGTAQTHAAGGGDYGYLVHSNLY